MGCLYSVNRSKLSSPVSYLNETSLVSLRTLGAPADPNRTRVTLCATWTDATTPFENVQLRAGSGDGPTLAAVSTNHPCATVTLEDAGLGLMGPLWLFHDGAADVVVNLSGIILLTNDNLQ